MDNKFWTKLFIITGALFVILLLWGADRAMGADTWPIVAEAGYVFDSITYEHYIEDTIADSSGKLCSSCTGWTDTLTVSSNQYHNYYLYFWPTGSSHRGSWGFSKFPTDTTSSSATAYFPIRAYWPDSAVSAGHRKWTMNGASIVSYGSASPSTDSNYSYVYNSLLLNTEYSHYISVDINYPGYDSTASWTWFRQPVFGGGSSSPPSADLATVFGYIRDSKDDPIVGAYISATRVSGNNAVDTTGTSVILPNITIGAYTDTLGYWEMYLRRTSTYRDTLKGFYNITATWDGQELFKIQRLYIPATGNLNVADSLAGR